MRGWPSRAVLCPGSKRLIVQSERSPSGVLLLSPTLAVDFDRDALPSGDECKAARDRQRAALQSLLVDGSGEFSESECIEMLLVCSDLALDELAEQFRQNIVTDLHAGNVRDVMLRTRFDRSLQLSCQKLIDVLDTPQPDSIGQAPRRAAEKRLIVSSKGWAGSVQSKRSRTNKYIADLFPNIAHQWSQKSSSECATQCDSWPTSSSPTLPVDVLPIYYPSKPPFLSRLLLPRPAAGSLSSSSPLYSSPPSLHLFARHFPHSRPLTVSACQPAPCSPFSGAFCDAKSLSGLVARIEALGIEANLFYHGVSAVGLKAVFPIDIEMVEFVCIVFSDRTPPCTVATESSLSGRRFWLLPLLNASERLVAVATLSRPLDNSPAQCEVFYSCIVEFCQRETLHFK